MYTCEPFFRYSAAIFAQAAEQRDAVPLGALLLLAGLLSFQLSVVAMRRLATVAARGHGPRFRIGAQVADENDFVDSARHGRRPFIDSVEGAPL